LKWLRPDLQETNMGRFADSDIVNFMKYILRVLIPFVILGSVVACQEDENLESIVLTEEILFIGGDKVRMSGRVLAISRDGIQDHGFYVAVDEAFTSPIVVSLGEKSIPGRFIGEAGGLDLKSDYYFKSYITSKGNTIFGSIVPFTTLGPFIEDFSPRIGLSGQTISITGGNFTGATEVYFGDSKAVIVDIKLESIIKVMVPEIMNNPFVEVKVVLGNEEMIFPFPYEYIIGKWEMTGTFIDDKSYYQSLFFQSDNKLFFGLGIAQGTGLNDKIWELDFNSWAWSEKPFTGTAVTNAFATNGFFGSGIKEDLRTNFILSNEFWRYDSATEDFEQLGTLPFGFSESVGIVLDQDLYLFGGITANVSNNFDYYKYDDTTGSWSLLGKARININTDYPNFQVNNLAFLMDENGGLFQYNAGDDIWTQVSQYPGTVKPLGFGVVMNNKVYIGMFGGLRQMYEYDPILNSWKRKISYPGNVLHLNVAWWTYNNMIYVMRSDIRSTGGVPMEIWSFDPEGF